MKIRYFFRMINPFGMQWRLLSLIAYFQQVGDACACMVAYLLPRKVVYWAAIRVAVNASKTPDDYQEIPAITVMDAIHRW